MLTKLTINNFKCFEHCEIELKNINLFAGVNSSGKSTAIQSILLLANNASRSITSTLNGQWLRLGSFLEARNFIKNAKKFSVSIEDESETFTVEFNQSDDDEKDVDVIKTVASNKIEKCLDLQNKHLIYLPATRQGPSDYYPRNFDNINFLGNNGEFIIDYFSRIQNRKISEELIVDKNSSTLFSQVNFWLKKIMNVNVQVEDLGISNTIATKFSFSNNKEVRPYHIGVGVSYILSILIACLSARKNDLIIIENPEIHLHPKAQSDLTEFLCFIANAGIQIVMESHSDHIFNGIRKAIAKNIIKTENATVHFFELNEMFLSTATSINIDANGRVLDYIKGLFDQFDSDLDELLGI